MTEDPVKLYVIVMAILLCVLSYVAIDSWKQANAFEAALDRAPREAEKMRQLASEVKGLVEQLQRSGLREGGERVLVERVQKDLGIVPSKFDTDPAPIGRGIRGKEKRVTVDFADPSMAMLNPNHAYGTVEDCIGYVTRLIEAGADEILFLCQMGTVPQAAQLETIRNIGEQVIPYFRTGPGAALLEGRSTTDMAHGE